MGAAEWTGYSSTAQTASYSTAYTPSGSYGYETTASVDHHSNFHLPTGNLYFTLKNKNNFSI